MTDLPRRAVTRGARLAALPLGVRRSHGDRVREEDRRQERRIVASEIQTRTAEQLFQVLGELKGGAMKFGQALSIFEAALPEEIAGPYRAALTKLQEAAPPMPATTVHKVLAEQLGRATGASGSPSSPTSRPPPRRIGQVHRAVWHDGREVAVKIQYPGAGKALLGDLNQLARLARMFAACRPASTSSRCSPSSRRGSPRSSTTSRGRSPSGRSPRPTRATRTSSSRDVLAAAPTVLVSEWIEGPPLVTIISDGTQEERDHVGPLYVRFLFRPRPAPGCCTPTRTRATSA